MGYPKRELTCWKCPDCGLTTISSQDCPHCAITMLEVVRDELRQELATAKADAARLRSALEMFREHLFDFSGTCEPMGLCEKVMDHALDAPSGTEAKYASGRPPACVSLPPDPG
jgi:hypothetical protein